MDREQLIKCLANELNIVCKTYVKAYDALKAARANNSHPNHIEQLQLYLYESNGQRRAIISMLDRMPEDLRRAVKAKADSHSSDS